MTQDDLGLLMMIAALVACGVSAVVFFIRLVYDLRRS